MKKLLLVMAIVSIVSAYADIKAADTSAGAAEVELADAGNDASPAWFSAGVDFDLFSAYVYRNAVIVDDLVFQPCAWLEITPCDFLAIGGWAWQNWDLTGRRSGACPRAMNESDFSVYARSTLWTSDDENCSFDLEAGAQFFTYRQQDGVPDSREFYVKGTFYNPLINIYGAYSQAYHPISACFFEAGLNKDVTLGEIFDDKSDLLSRISVGFDWNFSFGSGRYFSNYLYYQVPYGDWSAEDADYEGWENIDDGIGGTTFRVNVGYKVCDHFYVGLVLAYTAVLSDEGRESFDANGFNSHYKDLPWGGLQVKLDF